MMKQYRILLTSIGTATAVAAIKSLRKAENANVFIVGMDSNPRDRIAGSSLCDAFVTVPRYDEAAYLETVRSTCHHYDIKFILPIHDLEVAVLTKARNELDNIVVCASEDDVVTVCNDKMKTNQKLHAEGMVVPDVWPVRSEGPQQFTFPVFIKPRFGVGSANCYMAGQADELPYILRRVPDPIAQPVLSGAQYVLDILNDMKGSNLVVIPRIEYSSKAGVGTNVRIQRQPQLEAYGAKVAEVLKLKGPANIEVFYDGRSVQLIEVNPRLSAGHIFSVLAGVNLPMLAIRLFNGESVDLSALKWRDGLNINRYWEEVIIHDGRQS